jgi:large subunit ribosomal protein L19
MDWMKLVHGDAKSTLPAFKPGDRVRVWYRIVEQGKERLGQFEGDVIRARGSGPSRTFTVRRVTYGEGVERVFPFDCKAVARIEVLTQGKVHRSRLYYLRRVIGKTRIATAEEAAEAVPPDAQPAAQPASRAAAAP